MKKTDLLAGTGAIAAVLAVYTISQTEIPSNSPGLDSEHIIVVDPSGESTVATQTAEGEVTAAPDHYKWALGAALGTLIGGAAAIFGFNRLLNFLASVPRNTARVARSATTATGQAARSAGAAIGHILEKPGRIVAKGTVLTAGAILALALLDISWKASLAAGTGALIWSHFGWGFKKQKLNSADHAVSG